MKEILQDLEEEIECPLAVSDNGSLKIKGIQITAYNSAGSTPATSKSMSFDTSYGTPKPLLYDEEEKTIDESVEAEEEEQPEDGGDPERDLDCPVESGSKSSSKLGSIELDKALATTTTQKESQVIIVKTSDEKQQSGKKKMISSIRKSFSVRTKKHDDTNTGINKISASMKQVEVQQQEPPSSRNKKKGLLKKLGSMSVRRSRKRLVEI